MQKVVFFDRDGVINDDTGHYYIYKIEDFKFNEGVVEAMQLIVSEGYGIIVVSNQGGISKGEYSKANVNSVHDHMLGVLQQHGVYPLAIYYCPHHNKYEQCLCRKPQGLMIEKAIARFNIDKNKSFMIGDREKDVAAANNAGIKAYKIETNENILPLAQRLING